MLNLFFKHLTSNSATNLTMEVVEESIKTLIAKLRVINKKTRQGLDSFFIIDDQTEPEIELNDSMITTNTSGCLQKDTPRKSVNLSEETPRLSTVNSRSLDSYNMEEFTARVMATKAFFMNEIYELKQDIQSLKQKVNDGESFDNNKNKNNIVENLELQFSLLQQENNFLKTEITQKHKNN